MASQNPPTNVEPASMRTLGVYDTAKRCFLDIANMLKNGYPPPVFTDDRDVILTLMPSGAEFQPFRDRIEESLEDLKIKLNQQSKWEQVRVKSDDNEFSIVLYRKDVFSLKEKAVEFAITEKPKLRQLEYSEVGGSVSAI